MPRLSALVAIIPLLIAAPAYAQGGVSGGQSHGGPGSPAVSAADRDWLNYAATDNQGEIQESLLAEKKAHSLALKAFVRLMVDDHIQVESRLAALVNALAVDVPNGPGQKNAKTIADLEKLQGEEFDRRFIAEQIEDHRDDVKKFSDQIKSTQNEDVRRYAIETLPILKQHLALAEAVQASIGGGGSSASR